VSEGHVVVYEPRRLVREGLASFLARKFEVVACREVAELDLVLHGRVATAIVGLDGAPEPLWRVLAAATKARRELRVIGIATSIDPASARLAKRSGVREILPSDAGLQGVLDALADGRVRERAPRPAMLRVVPPPVPELTPRERDVVRLISSGFTASQIATELRISAKTVENHKQRVFRKLDVQSQSHAVAVALRLGLLSPIEGREPAGPIAQATAVEL